METAMMATNVLDNVIAATVNTTIAAPGMTRMTANEAITAALQGPRYLRGTARPMNRTESVKEMLTDAGMAWKVVEMPVAVVGTRETRVADAYKAIVRSDTGVTMDITSQRYTPFQNWDVFGTFLHAADAMGGQVVSTSVLDEGRALSATINLGKNGKLAAADGSKVGDIVGLTAVITTGHRVGMAFKMKGQAFRLVCLNGLTIEDGSTSLSMSISHNRKWSSNDTRRVQAAVASYLARFDKFLETANELSATRITRDMYRAYFLELFNSETLVGVRDAAASTISTSVVGGVRNQLSVGRVVLDNILADTDTYFGGMGRTAKRVADLAETQPGHSISGSTMWDALNAVTYYVDHERGREVGASVLSSIMGDGDRLKSRALDLAIDYTQRIRMN